MAKTDTRKLTPGEIGKTGTYIFSGYITGEEYKEKLQGIQGLTIYDQMRKSDATVRVSLLAIFLPILEANWYIEPANDDPANMDISKFVEKALFDEMEITWTDFLRQALLYLVFGRFVFEKVFKMGADGLIYWEKFGPRLPKTILKWEMDNGQAGITQTLPNSSTAVNIPMEKLLVFVNEKEGDNWEGVSILRSAYLHWYFKQSIYKVEAMSIERQGLGIPVITTPPNTTPEDEARAEEIVKNLRANEKAYARLSEGWTLEIMDMKGTSTRNVEASILHHDRQIVKNVMAQFLELGASGGGSYALQVDQNKLFTLSLTAIAKYVAGIVNQAIKEIVDYNFNVEEYPQLKFSDIGQVDYNGLSQAVQRFAQSGLLTATPKTEDHIRDLLDLPEITEEERAEMELTKFLDNIDKVNAPQPEMGQFPPKPFMKPLQAAEGVVKDKKDEKKPDDKKDDVVHAPQFNPERASKQQELKSFVLEMRKQLEDMKVSGVPVTPEFVADIKKQIMEKQQEVGDATASMDMFAHDHFKFSENREKIGETLEKIENVIANISK